MADPIFTEDLKKELERRGFGQRAQTSSDDKPEVSLKDEGPTPIERKTIGEVAERPRPTGQISIAPRQQGIAGGEVAQIRQRKEAENAAIPQDQIEGAVAKPPDTAEGGASGGGSSQQITFGGGGAAPTVTPETWVNTLSPEDRALQAAGRGMQVEGADTGAQAEAQGAENVGRIADVGSQQIRDMQERNQRDYAIQQKQLNDHIAQLQANATKIASRPNESASNKYWRSKSTVEKVGLAIALGLGGFAAGFKGGPNHVQEMIRGYIDDEANAEQKDYEAAKEGQQNMQTLYAQKKALFDDDAKARAATVQEKQQAVAAMIDAEARKYNSPQILAKAEQMKGALFREFAAEGSKTNQYVPAKAIPGAAGPDQEYARYAKSMLEKGDMNIVPKDEWIRTVYGGAGGRAATPKEAKEGAKKSPEQMLNETDALIANLGRAPNSSIWTNPGAAASRAVGLQGSQGQAAALAQGSYNTALELNLHQMGVRLGDPAKAEKFLGQWKINANDTPGTIKRKTTEYRNFVLSQIPGATPSAGSSAPSRGFVPVGQ